MVVSDSCLICGGLIMKPGVSYGYAGPVCHCIVPPRIQVPRSGHTSFTQETNDLSKSDFRNMFESLVNTKNNLINALNHVNHEILRYESKGKTK